ncbi:MAG: molybdopterin-guanine dinucleotide biosynthesis protein B [Candidatus Aminicenantes bacterium]|nr:molybdopterin-guanine dinucleotide biosynthesis protein B [Candidatus Aminicenantes bacterium]
MKIIAFVGDSGSGKTRLIRRLVPELKKRGMSVAVIKHCAHGFDLGGKDKDSSKFLAAGADGVALVSPERQAVIKKGGKGISFTALARDAFRTADIVLVEGGRKDKALKKIEVLRHGLSGGIKSSGRELAAVVADFQVACQAPVFHPRQFKKIADWMDGGLSWKR